MKEQKNGGKISIRFEPMGVEITAVPPIRLMDAAAEAGISLEHPCGGGGLCGLCKVKIDGARPDHTEAEEALLTEEEIGEGIYLSCKTVLTGSSIVECKTGRITEAGIVIIEGVNAPVELRPYVSRLRMEIPAPSLDDQRSDQQRLLDEISKTGRSVTSINPEVLALLPGLLRTYKWNVSIIVFNEEIVAVREYEDNGRILGVAIDVGTSTVVASLIDLETGEELDAAGAVNKQILFGPDVISRIGHARGQENGIAQLQEKILETINQLIDTLLERTGEDVSHVWRILAAGNTIMQHLLLGIDPIPIASTPFVPATNQSIERPAGNMDLRAAPQAYLSVSPSIAGYIGGDIVADILACGMHCAQQPSLLIDIGTNAEIVLGCQDRMLACSSPAGPAFEGWQIECGMRAMEGAIASISIENEDLNIQTIENAEPAGICGSGLIDALAVLLQLGVVDGTGRLLGRDEYEGPDWARERIVTHEDLPSFVLTPPPKKPIYLSSLDVRNLQLAKAGIQAGIRIALKKWNLRLDELENIFIAGAFGSKICPESAQIVGLIPPISYKKIQFIGNSAHVGAKLMLLSYVEWEFASLISEKMCYFELAGQRGFQNTFSESIGFGEDWKKNEN